MKSSPSETSSRQSFELQRFFAFHDIRGDLTSLTRESTQIPAQRSEDAPGKCIVPSELQSSSRNGYSTARSTEIFATLTWLLVSAASNPEDRRETCCLMNRMARRPSYAEQIMCILLSCQERALHWRFGLSVGAQPRYLIVFKLVMSTSREFSCTDS